MTFDECLAYYLTLKDGWDGPHSKGIEHLDVARLRGLCERLPKRLERPTPMASCEGRVGVYWDTALGYCDIEFETGYIVSVFTKNRVTGAEDFNLIDDKICTTEWLDQHVANILVGVPNGT